VGHLFLSYSRRDTDFVRRLCDALASAEREAWVDWQDIPASADWSEEIRLAIESAEAVVAVISPDSVRSRVCAQELAHAVEHHKRLVPLLYRPTPDDDVPEALASLNWIHCRAEDDVEGWMALLIEALDTDLDWVRAHTRLLVRALEWQAGDEDRSLLLRGVDLVEAETAVASGIERDPKPTADQARFLLASRQAATRHQRGAITTVAVVAVVVAMLASLAWWQRGVALDQRDTARARLLVATSRERLASDPELSLLLAREADAIKPIPEVELALRQAVADSRVRATLALEAKGDAVEVFGAVFSPDARLVATAGSDGAVRAWDWIRRSEPVIVGRHDGAANALAFLPDGRHIASGGDDGTVRVWDVAGRRPVASLPPGPVPVYAVALSPGDGRLVAAARGDGTVALWDWALPGDARPRVLAVHANRVLDVSFSPDAGRLVTSAFNDGVARVWDLASGREVAALRHPGSQVYSVAFSPDGRRIATGDPIGFVRLWDPARPEQPLEALRSHGVGGVNSVSFGPGVGGVVLSAGTDGTVVVRDPEVDAEPLAVLRGHRGFVLAAAFSADGRLVVSGGSDGRARVWEWAGPGARALGTHGAPVSRAVVSPDGTAVASAGQDGAVRFWGTVTGKALGDELPDSTDVVFDLAFSPDGRQILAGGHDRVARVWDWPGRELRARLPHPAEVSGVAFSPDGSLVATGFASGLGVWSWAEERVVGELPLPGLVSVAFSPDGALVAAGDAQGSVRVIDWRERRVVAKRKVHGGPVWNVSFSPDGRRVLSASGDQGAALWTLQPDALRRLLGHRDQVLRARFSADGERVVTASADGGVRVWDAVTGRTVVELRPHGGPVRDAAFLGRDQLVTAGDDGAVRVTTCEACRPLAEVRRLAAARSTRLLDAGERAAYLGEVSERGR